MNSIDINDLYQVFLAHPVISTDSRAITKGCIFFALKGDNFNGNEYAAQALEKGAAFAVVDESRYVAGNHYLLADDTLKPLQKLARHHREQLTIPVIGITGSNGKTTTKELIRQVLSTTYRTYSTKGNLNNHIGVPLSILSITKNHELAVIEMGANHQGEIAMLCEIALPSYGIINNVGKAHLEGFGGFEGVKKGKGELYRFISKYNGVVFINSDNAHLREMADNAQVTDRITYGKEGTVYCRGELTQSQPTLHVKWQCGEKSGEVLSQLIGEYNFENILAAVCIGNYFSVPPEQINNAIEAYVPDNSRSQIVIKGNNKIILDAYNANPTSMAAALKNFALLPDKHKVLFLGDMAELGSESATEHQAIADILSEMLFDEVVLVGKNFNIVTLSKPHPCFLTSDEATAYAKERNYTHATILIKGSHSSKMEKVLEAF
jgi:UDP-N-acetylmuramoyl-tripeptide--D-alanyl-D-alanine ligase